MKEQVRHVLESKYDRSHRMSKKPRPPSRLEVPAPRERSEAAEFDEGIAAAIGRVMPRIPRRQETGIADELMSPLISESWNDFLRAAEIRGVADNTLRIMEHVSRSFVAVIEDKRLIDLRSTDVDAWIVEMRRNGNSPSTISLKTMWVKTWLNFCLGRGRLGGGRECNRRVVLSFDPSEIQRIKVPRTVRKVADLERIRQFLDVLDRGTFDGLRLHTQVLLMLDTGARAGEVTGMDTIDVGPRCESVKVMGKGSKERLLHLSPTMAETLCEWVSYRNSSMRAAGLEDNVVLFPSLYGLRQTSMQIGERFRTVSKRAGISPALTCHSLRHFWTARHATHNTNVFLLRQMGGWSDLSIVMRYVGEMSDADASKANQNSSAVGELMGRRVPRRRE